MLCFWEDTKGVVICFVCFEQSWQINVFCSFDQKPSNVVVLKKQRKKTKLKWHSVANMVVSVVHPLCLIGRIQQCRVTSVLMFQTRKVFMHPFSFFFMSDNTGGSCFSWLFSFFPFFLFSLFFTIFPFFTSSPAIYQTIHFCTRFGWKTNLKHMLLVWCNVWQWVLRRWK